MTTIHPTTPAAQPPVTAADVGHALRGRKCGKEWLALCPLHESDGRPHKPSLSIGERNGKLLVVCRAGCDQRSLIAELRRRGLWPARPRADWTPAQRRAWAREKRELERSLPEASLWRRAAVLLVEAELESLKTGLADPAVSWPEIGEIHSLTRLLGHLERLEGATLIQEYRRHREHYPHIVGPLVAWVQLREAAERAAIERYIGEMA